MQKGKAEELPPAGALRCCPSSEGYRLPPQSLLLSSHSPAPQSNQQHAAALSGPWVSALYYSAAQCLPTPTAKSASATTLLLIPRVQLICPSLVPAVPTARPRTCSPELMLHLTLPYLGFLTNTSSTEHSREKGGERVSPWQHGPAQHKGMRTGHTLPLNPKTNAPGTTTAHKWQTQEQEGATTATTSCLLNPQPEPSLDTQRDLQPSVPVSRASLRKERDWEVPVRGCQSSASSISRSLPGSHAGVLGGSTWGGGCL